MKHFQQSRRTSTRLRYESLETRNLLAGLCHTFEQNRLLPEDVNRDSHVSPIDTLMVINHLNGDGEPACDANPGSTRRLALDVSGDKEVSPRDVLATLNFINFKGEGEPGTADGDISIQIGPSSHIVYNSNTGTVDLDTQDGLFTTLEIVSRSRIFTGDPGQNLDGSFDVDRDDKIFKLSADGFPSTSFGAIAQTGLTEEFLLTDLVVSGSGPTVDENRNPAETAIMSSEDVTVDLIVTDLSGDRITQLEVGDEFFLVVDVRDTRFGFVDPPEGSGVFAAYVDIFYDDTLAQPVGDIVHGATFENGRVGTLESGLMNDVGAFANSIAPPGREAQELFRVRMQVIGDGDLTFTADEGDSPPGTDVLVYGVNDVVDVGRINFGADSIATIDDTPDLPNLVQFAKDLEASSTLFYGAAWCDQCTEQKEMFEDGQVFLPFVEVTNFDTDPNRGLNQIAIDNDISIFPTWVFPDGSRAEGVQDLQTISDRSGVPIPVSKEPQILGLESRQVSAGSPLHIPLNGYHPNQEKLTFTVTSDDPDLVEPMVLEGNRSLLIDVEGFGEMNFQLFDQRAPRVTDQIGGLADEGFYENIIFHRIINDFVIQGGDPTGTGSGSSDRPDFDDQFHVDLQHNQTGILSMAKSSDDTNNSQFFITEGPTRHLDANHSIFGQLIEGESNRANISDVFTASRDLPSPEIAMRSVTTFQDDENGLVMLKAPEDAFGIANITVTVTDEKGRQAQETFAVTVVPDFFNTDPFLNDIAELRTAANTPLTFDLTAQDVEGDPVFFSGNSLGQNFDVDVDEMTGRVTVTPPTGFVGTLRARFGVDASANATSGNAFDQQEVDIEVFEIANPDPPTLSLASVSDTGFSNTDNITIAQPIDFEIAGAQLNATLTLAVREPGGELTAIGSAQATDSTAVISTDQLVENGAYEIIVTQDAGGDSTLQLQSNTIVVIIARRDMPAVESTPPESTIINQPFVYDVVHPDESTTGFSFSLANAPSEATIDATTGVVSWTPTELGSNPFSIAATDLAGNRVSHDFAINVVEIVTVPAGNDLVDFAQRLTDAGTTLYGAPWDPASTAQRQMFDEGSLLLDFVDITDANRQLNETAEALQISVLPTWIFADGTRLEGMQSLEEISAATGIQSNDTDQPWLAELSETVLYEGSPLHIPLDGFDASGEGLTFSVNGMPDQVEAAILSGNRQMRIRVAGYGDMVFELFDDRVPELTQHISGLVESGFYNDREFYRVNERLIQTGDDQNLGMGSPNGHAIDDSFHGELQHNRSGILSMAKLIDDGNSSNFFVTSGTQRGWDFQHSIFGQLVEGESVRAAIEATPKMVGGVPKFSIVIESVEIIENSEDAVLMLSTSSDAIRGGDVTVSASNAEGNSFERSFTLNVRPDEHDSAPFLNAVENVTTGAGRPVQVSVTATDVEGDDVRFRARAVGEIDFEVEFDETTGEIIAHPPIGYIGTLQLEVAAFSSAMADRVDRYDRQTIEIFVSSDGDLNGDAVIDTHDIDLLCQAIRDESTDPKFDIDLNGSLDLDDFDTYIRDIVRVSFGDANLDGRFDTDDLMDIFKAGTYEDGAEDNGSWSVGDWNCDGEFDSSDLVAAFKFGRYRG